MKKGRVLTPEQKKSMKEGVDDTAASLGRWLYTPGQTRRRSMHRKHVRKGGKRK